MIQPQLAGGISGNTAAIAHAAAIDDGQSRLQNSHIAGNII